LLKLTSNALVTLVLTEQDCVKELFETVNVTQLILHTANGKRLSLLEQSVGIIDLRSNDRQRD